jgi:hypothetical protein
MMMERYGLDIPERLVHKVYHAPFIKEKGPHAYTQGPLKDFSPKTIT